MRAGQDLDAATTDTSDSELVARYDERIPRYTSYPTAPHFSSDIDSPTYAQWLDGLAPESALSLYIHIPFCAELCLYCGCHTTVVRRYDPVENYVGVLEREIALVAERLSSPRPVVHIHWGGGTPTILSPRDMLRLSDTLRSRFDVLADSEIAVEIDPRRISLEHVGALAEMGTTRASLGIQDFDPQVQRVVNRIQSFDETARVVSWLREAGVTALNFDLMYGLPHQTVDTVVASVRRAVSLDPDRIALFGYAHVPWMKRHQALLPEAALPNAAERLSQMRASAEAIRGSGYVPIGLDHFAKPGDLLARRQSEGRLHRNFQGYTTDSAAALIGLGVSAIGALPEGYVQNASPTAAYRNAILAGNLATTRGIRLNEEDRVRRAIIERLMCDLVVDLDGVAAQYRVTTSGFSSELERLDDLAEHGLVRREGHRIVIPESARPFARTVCAVFDPRLSEGRQRYSRSL